MDKKVIRFHLTFMDESELIFTSNTTDRKSAVSDFLIKAWVEIDGKFYNKSLVFNWKVIED